MVKHPDESISIKLAVIEEKLDRFSSLMEEHVKTSQEYRDMTTKNCSEIKWHSKWLYAISSGVLICLSALTGMSLIGR